MIKRNFQVSFLITVLLVSILIRSLYLYQHAGDTWEALLKSKLIIRDGLIPWFIHPFSVLGWYPLSDASGESVLLASLFELTGLSVKSMVIFLPTYFAVMGILFMFLLSRAISSDKFFQLLVIAIFPFYRYPIGITYDSLATRGMFLMFLPIVFFAYIKYFKINNLSKQESNLRYLSLVILFTFILCSIHRLFNFFLFCAIMPLFLVFFYNRLTKYQKINSYLDSTNYKLGFLLIIFILQILNITVRDFESQSSLTQKFTQSIFPQELETNIAILNLFSVYIFKTGNLVFDYTYWYNVTTVFLIFGIFHVLNLKNSLTNFFFLSFSISLLFVLDIQYFLIYFSPTCAILSASGVVYLLNNKKQNLSTLPILALLLGGLTLTIFYVIKDGIISGFYPFFFFLMGMFLLVKYFLLGKYNHVSKLKSIFVVSIFFIGLSYSLIPTLLYADKVNEQLREGEGDLLREYQGYDQSVWVSEYLKDPFLETSPYERNLIWTLSEVPSSMDFYDLVGNPILIEDMDPEFNLSTFSQTGRYLFSKDYEDHHYPRNLRHFVFYMDDSYWAERYDVNWIIVNKVEASDSTCIYCFKELENIIDVKYATYSDSTISIYYYDNY